MGDRKGWSFWVIGMEERSKVQLDARGGGAVGVDLKIERTWEAG